MKTKIPKTLVVGIDFSDYSQIVVRQAQKMSAVLEIPTVYIFVEENAMLRGMGLKLRQKEAAPLYEQKIRSQYKIEKHEKIVIRFGPADKEVIAAAKQEKNPLIFVGYRSGHAIARFFLGSVAEKLAAISPFPVWIHRGDKNRLPQKILVPSDFSRRSEKVIKAVDGIRETLKSKVEVYHVLTEPMPVLDYNVWSAVENGLKKEDDRRLKTFKKKHAALNVMRTRGSIVESIVTRAKKFDLIAISPRRKAKVPFGRVTGKVIRSSPVPVLVITQEVV